MQNHIEMVGEELAYLDTMNKLDEALLQTEWSIEYRAGLMMKRIELANAARRAMGPPPVPFSGGVILTVPSAVGCTDIIGADGRTYKSTTSADGRTVVDVPPAVFTMLLGGAHGKLWLDCNQDPTIWHRMQPGLHSNAVA